MRFWASAPLLVSVLALSCEGADILIGIERAPIVDAGQELVIARKCPPCSSDLHAQIDCDGRPILYCPPELACVPSGGCASPCSGAAQAKLSLGCDFFVLEPDVQVSNWQGSCHALLIANAWELPTRVTLDRGGTQINPDIYIPQRLPNGSVVYTWQQDIPGNGMGMVFLGASKNACGGGVQSSIGVDFAVHGTGRGNAIRVQTEMPVTLVDVYPWSATVSNPDLPAVPSASLLLPIATWDDHAFGVTGWSLTQGDAGSSNTFWSGLAVTSASSTLVKITPSRDVAASALGPAIAKGASRDVPIGTGEIVQIEQLADLTGTTFSSSAHAPIAIWGTHQCMNIPTAQTTACDAAHQQIPPQRALGNEYVAVRYRPRSLTEDKVPWRMVAVVDTQLSFEFNSTRLSVPVKRGAELILQDPGPFVVRSPDLQHPFYMSAHMTGYGATMTTEGDPESVNVIPTDQWLTSYTFPIDPTYRNLAIVVVRKRKDGAFHDVIGCAGPLHDWNRIGDGKYEHTSLEIFSDGKKRAETCDFGLARLSSDAPFTGTVWATDKNVSYAYPIGAAVLPINDITQIPPPP